MGKLNNNYEINNLIKTELFFPKLFSNMEEREWGIFFFNEDNKSSHDSNHCVILVSKITHLMLEEIKLFYQQKQMVPRIYHSFINGFLDQNRSILNEHGFKIEENNDDQYMILTSDSQIKHYNQLNIQELNSWDERITHDILIPNHSEYETSQLKDAIKHKQFKLFVGYKDHQAVTMASLYYSDDLCVRLDHVQTALHHRKQGFSKEIIDFVVNYYNNQNSHATFYLSVDNPIAIHIYHKAGFRLSKTRFESWTAVYDKE